MSEAILEPQHIDASDGEEFQYRPLSTAAIASVLFGVVSSVTFFAGSISLQTALLFCPIPIIGLLCGMTAIKKIKAMPEMLSGFNVAVAGTVMSTLGLVGGMGYAGFVHATEVPPGYERISFYSLRPDDVEQKGNEAVPRDVLALDGQQVFIKGYMRPGTHYSKSNTPVRHNVSKFLLVRDSNECCFGDISTVKYYDKLGVQLVEGVKTDYSSGIFRVAGTLKILPPEPKSGRLEPVYTLEAEYVH